MCFVNEKRANDTMRTHEGAMIALGTLRRVPLRHLERGRGGGERGKGRGKGRYIVRYYMR